MKTSWYKIIVAIIAVLFLTSCAIFQTESVQLILEANSDGFNPNNLDDIIDLTVDTLNLLIELADE